MNSCELYIESFKANNGSVAKQLQLDLLNRVAEFEEKDEQHETVIRIAQEIFLQSAEWAGGRGGDIAFEKCNNDQALFDEEFRGVWERYLGLLLGRYYHPNHPAYVRLLKKKNHVQTTQQE